MMHKLWLDAHLSPALAAAINRTFLDVEASSLRSLGLRDAADEVLFEAARSAAVVFMTKDADFLTLLDRHGPPPSVLWVTCGNTTTAKMRELLDVHIEAALALIDAGAMLVELTSA